MTAGTQEAPSTTQTNSTTESKEKLKPNLEDVKSKAEPDENETLPSI